MDAAPWLASWSTDDQAFAQAVQVENYLKLQPLGDHVGPLIEPGAPGIGASDDVGDVTWTAPTVTVMFPSNIPSVPMHNVLAAVAMATPIAHKGAVAGAKAVAMAVLDMMTTPKLLADAQDFFKNVQIKDQSYAARSSSSVFIAAITSDPPVHFPVREHRKHIRGQAGAARSARSA